MKREPRSRLPARSTTHRQEDQNQRKSTFERLGPSGSHNRESRRDHSQSHRVEQPRKTRAGLLPRQPHRITLIKTTVGQKEVPNRNSKKPERTIDSPVLQTDLRQYDYLTSSNCPTTLNMMARLNQDSGSGYIRNRLN